MFVEIERLMFWKTSGCAEYIAGVFVLESWLMKRYFGL